MAEAGWTPNSEVESAIDELKAQVQKIYNAGYQQARVQELEQWVQDQSTANLETMRHTDEMQSRAIEAESQLTQRTAERDTARRRVDELEAREVDVVMLREDLEQRTAALEAAEGKLDIILRTIRGEPDDELAVDYGAVAE